MPFIKLLSTYQSHLLRDSIFPFCYWCLLVLLPLTVLVAIGCSNDGGISTPEDDTTDIEIDPDAAQVRITIHTFQNGDEPLVIDRVTGEAFYVTRVDTISPWLNETAGIEGCRILVNGFEMAADTAMTHWNEGQIAYYRLEDPPAYEEGSSFACSVQIPPKDNPNSDLLRTVSVDLATSALTFHAPAGDSTRAGEELYFSWEPALEPVPGRSSFYQVAIEYAAQAASGGWYLMGSTDYFPAIESSDTVNTASSFTIPVEDQARWCDLVITNFYFTVGSEHELVDVTRLAKAEIIVVEERHIANSYEVP